VFFLIVTNIYIFISRILEEEILQTTQEDLAELLLNECHMDDNDEDEVDDQRYLIKKNCSIITTSFKGLTKKNNSWMSSLKC
jgi:hypothetical protein